MAAFLSTLRLWFISSLFGTLQREHPATFDEVANKARSIEGFENVGPDLDADYRRSQARQESRENSEPRHYNERSNDQPHFQRYDDQKRDSHGHGKQDKRHNPFSGMGDYKRRR